MAREDRMKRAAAAHGDPERVAARAHSHMAGRRAAMRAARHASGGLAAALHACVDDRADLGRSLADDRGIDVRLD